MEYDMKRETQEAIDAGERALASLKAAQDELSSAKNWGIFDMLGGGFVSTLVKHNKMDNAKKMYKFLETYNRPRLNQEEMKKYGQTDYQ